MPFVSRQMALTTSEFLSRLPRAAHPHPCRIEAEGANIAVGAGEVRIECREMEPRCIGSISLPVLCVEMTASGLSAEEIDAFMTRFDRSYQRGGG